MRRPSRVQLIPPESSALTKPDALKAVIDNPGSLVFDQIDMATNEVKEEILRLILRTNFIKIR